jgi:hypothetical protein
MCIRAHDLHVLCSQLKRSALEMDIAWCIRKHETKVDMDDVALHSTLRPQQALQVTANILKYLEDQSVHVDVYKFDC